MKDQLVAVITAAMLTAVPWTAQAQTAKPPQSSVVPAVKTFDQRLAEALVEWFPQHAASMDAGLALHLKDVGFDSVTETLADPERVRPASMSGCGSVTCS